MGQFGFAYRQLWVLFVLADGDAHPAVMKIEHLDEWPDEQFTAGLVDVCANFVDEDSGNGQVAMLFARPGGGALSASDRAWTSALYRATQLGGVASHPIHLANDVELRWSPPTTSTAWASPVDRNSVLEPFDKLRTARRNPGTRINNNSAASSFERQPTRRTKRRSQQEFPARRCTMNALHTFASASAVASCTLAAAHRRDHDHGVEVVACHPHVVEVVHLGEHAAMICPRLPWRLPGFFRTARPSGWLPPPSRHRRHPALPCRLTVVRWPTLRQAQDERVETDQGRVGA